MTQTTHQSRPSGAAGGYAMIGATVSAAVVAVAIVAACRRTGGDAAHVFDAARGNKRTRAMAAAACVRGLGLTARDAGRLFRIEPVRLAPTKLTQHRIGEDDLEAVISALAEHGLERPAAEPAPSPGPAPVPKTANPVRGSVRPAPRRVGGAAGVRLRPITDDMVRWTRAHAAAGTPVATMAELFDVDADDLAARVNPEIAEAA